jgi:uncharacterized membrane protein
MNSAAVKLFLTLFWLVPGLALLVHDLVTGQPTAVPMGRWQLPFAWICLLLAAFNFVRWWSARSRDQTARQAAVRQRPRKPTGEPDPAFRFDDPTQFEVRES